ncbi:MAG: hypothetical protein ACR65R_01560 [Methylomicrobium sp.]
MTGCTTIGHFKVPEGSQLYVYKWPPAAAIYWPMGFNPDITYDLVNGTQE